MLRFKNFIVQRQKELLDAYSWSFVNLKSLSFIQIAHPAKIFDPMVVLKYLLRQKVDKHKQESKRQNFSRGGKLMRWDMPKWSRQMNSSFLYWGPSPCRLQVYSLADTSQSNTGMWATQVSHIQEDSLYKRTPAHISWRPMSRYGQPLCLQRKLKTNKILGSIYLIGCLGKFILDWLKLWSLRTLYNHCLNAELALSQSNAQALQREQCKHFSSCYSPKKREETPRKEKITGNLQQSSPKL